MREEPKTKRRTIRDGYVAPTGQPERPRRLNDEKLTKIRPVGKSDDALGDIPMDTSAEVAQKWLDGREERLKNIDGEL